jgi:acyl-coenzyme A synthetase/AMP-(fatty) acid ligase/aryl carrier-like protein
LERPLGRHLRLVIFGGEPLDCRALLPWLDRHPQRECRLVNMYGITETTVHVTLKSIGRGEALQASRSVGSPIAGWQCFVLDARRRLLPPGVQGEIYVGGAGVAAGYHNRDDLTGERFVPNPFGPGLLYRSGDVGRQLFCGSLEHLGRMDSQVKLRGFRIELDEIRNVLLAIDGVSTAAIVLRQEDSSDAATARLDAYLVLSGAALSDVRNRARRLLPDFMMPASFTAIPELPLTQNGKLDIQRLPPPEAASAPTTPEQTAADTRSLEEAMRQVWQLVLKTDVRLDDNFFDLGGNSLQAIRLIAALREHALPALDIRQLYARQTIRRLLESQQPSVTATG